MRYYWYYKACTKYFPVLLRTTKLAQNTSQHYFVLQSLHKIRTSTTSYYKTCTQYFPVLLHTTKLAQNTSQYYFVLQSLHITKHNGTARGIFQTPRPRSADNGDHSSAARTQTGPVAQTKFPTSTPERSCARKHRVSFNSYPPRMDKAFEAAIPMQNANLGQQTQWRSAWNLSKITSARRWQRGPLERSTARAQTGPRAQTASTLGTTLKGENISFRSIPTPQASPAQSVRSSDSNATCKPGSPNNGTAHGIFQRSLPCSPDKTTRAPHEGKPDPSHKRGSPHRRQEPHYARKRIFSFLYILPKHHLDKAFEAAIPMQNASLDHQTQWQQRMESLKDHLRAALTMGTTLSSAARTQTGPVAQTGFPTSTHIDAGSHITFDSCPPNITWTQQFHCDMQSPACRSQYNSSHLCSLISILSAQLD